MNKKNNIKFPLITVLICTYNKFDYLKGSIDSVLQQEYPCLELIVADDASKDFPKTQIEEYINNNKNENISNFTVYSNSKNLGTVKNLNNGAKRALGKYIIFMAGDDEFYDSAVLERVVCEAERRNCGLLITMRLVSDESLRPLYFLPHSKSVKRILRFNNNLQQYEAFVSSMDYNMASGSVFCLRRNIFENMGRYDEKYHLWEDGPFLEKYLWKYKLEFAYDIISVRYRTGGVSDYNVINPLLKKDEGVYRITDRIMHIDEVSRCTKTYIRMSNLADEKKMVDFIKLGITHPICLLNKMIYRIRLAIYKRIDEKMISGELQKYASNKIHVPAPW